MEASLAIPKGLDPALWSRLPAAVVAAHITRFLPLQQALRVASRTSPAFYELAFRERQKELAVQRTLQVITRIHIFCNYECKPWEFASVSIHFAGPNTKAYLHLHQGMVGIEEPTTNGTRCLNVRWVDTWESDLQAILAKLGQGSLGVPFVVHIKATFKDKMDVFRYRYADGKRREPQDQKMHVETFRALVKELHEGVSACVGFEVEVPVIKVVTQY